MQINLTNKPKQAIYHVTYKNYSPNLSSKTDSVSFTGIKHASPKTLKSIFLAIMTLASSSNVLKADTAIVKAVDEAVKTPIIQTIKTEFNAILEKLTKDIPSKTSYYYDYKVDKTNIDEVVRGKKLADYKALLENIPERVSQKGDAAIVEYQRCVISILQTCSEYGAMYVKHIPDPQNIRLHEIGLKALSDASEKIQGCRFQNAAIFNGFSAEDLMKKIVIPNKKIADGQKIGTNQNTLIFIAHEQGFDGRNAYKATFNSMPFFNKHAEVAYNKYNFAESFLGHYDNIIVIQPSKKNADEVLNTAFTNIEQGLDKGAKTDIIYIAHSVDGFDGAMLSDRYSGNNDSVYMIDKDDFMPLQNGGKPFAQSIANIFRNSIDTGYTPRIIGDGCKSEFLQSAINQIMPDGYKEKVHIFGSPYFINGVSPLGFLPNEKLAFIAKVDDFFGERNGLIMKLTETEKAPDNAYQTNLFTLTNDVGKESSAIGLDKKIIGEYKKGQRFGTAVKPNGMEMDYEVITYAP